VPRNEPEHKNQSIDRGYERQEEMISSRPCAPSVPLQRHLRRIARDAASFLCQSLFVVLSAAVTEAGASGLKPATFLPQWSPQAQFAGYFVAYEKGFYRDQGIDLTILAGGPDHSPSQFLEEGRADFVTLWLSTALQMRARGVPVVNIGQVVQRSALMLVAKKSSGIHDLRDLDGRKVAVWAGDFRLQPDAFFRTHGLEVQTVPLGQSIHLFLRDGVAATTAMWYNEYHAILSAGLNPDELTTFFFDEYDLNFPEDGLYCLADTRRKRPALVAGFVRASWDGWEYAFTHPEEALDIIMRRMADSHLPANRVQQRWMLARMRDIMRHRVEDVGASRTLVATDYHRVARILRDGGWIGNAPRFESFYQPPRDN
jgi:NitT/TauT family transport system substrate-binding protein